MAVMALIAGSNQALGRTKGAAGGRGKEKGRGPLAAPRWLLRVVSAVRLGRTAGRDLSYWLSRRVERSLAIVVKAVSSASLEGDLK